MKLKTDENGMPVFGPNKLPIYVNDDGSDYGEFDAANALAAINRANGEARDRRLELKQLKDQLEAFADLDPEAARDALEKISKIDAKKLMDAGKVDELKAEINKAWEAKLKAATDRAATLEAQLRDEKIGGAFARSPFVVGDGTNPGKLAIPVDMAQHFFGRHFKVEEDGSVRAYHANGNPITSKARPGEPADFDEALEQLVDQYPHKESIMRAKQGSGSGAGGGNGAGRSGNTVSRERFTAMSPSEQMKHVQSGGVITD